jgi:replicative DNA helicase
MKKVPQHIEFDPLRDGIPVALEAERFLLGSCLSFRRMGEVASRIAADDFGQENHRVLWEIMRELHEAGDEVNYSTVAIRLEGRREDIERIGGLGYMVELDSLVPNLPNIEPYVREIREKSTRRRLIFKCNEAMLRLAINSEDAISVAVELEEESRNCAMSIASRSGFSTVKEIISDAGGLDGYLKRRNEEGVRYPWENMNRLTGGGMRAGDLIVVAGSTGTGKTALALNMAHHAARHGHGVAIFSLEMDRQEITDRMISIESHIDGRVLRRQPDAAQRDQIRAGVANLLEFSFFIHDQTSPSIKSVRGELKRLMAKERIGLVIIDYIQLVEAAVRRSGNRAEEVGSITRSLKQMAKEFKLPVIALSQLNRDSAKDKREPQLYDLRESGSIEQDANLVAMIHFTRPYDTAAGVDTGDLSLFIRKQRAGPKGAVGLTFNAPSGRFFEPETRRN